MNKRRRKGRAIRIIFTLFVLALSITALSVIGGAVYIERNFSTEVDLNEYTTEAISKKTNLYFYEFTDRKNRIGVPREYNERVGSAKNSVTVKYSDLPKDLINAFVCIEDKRFFEHNGVDYRRTVGAGINYLIHSADSYGGSTITQQVIKNITGNNEYSIERKIQEMLLALDLERKMSKTQILELYLNIINLAHGNYGVGEAARYYFSKNVKDLDLYECATIAAITSSPSNLDPLDNPKKNVERRNMILSLMLEQGYISRSEYEEAVSSELRLKICESIGYEEINSWYVDMAIDDVIADLMEKYGYTYEKASLEVYSGGLNIYLAIDPRVQDILESYYKDNSNFPVHDDKTTAQSSAIVIDPETGDILGVVGGRGEKTGNRILNFASKAQRPTGSVIKPLSVYAPALERNIINYASVYDDVPVSFVEGANGGLRPWPYNYNFEYEGLVNINRALTYSINTVSVRVLKELGAEESFGFLAEKLGLCGLTSEDKQAASLALGQFTYGTTLRDITGAYSIFANGGVYSKPRSYFMVTDSNGKILLSNDESGKKVIGSDTACIMTKMLCNVVSDGTAHNVTLDRFVDCAAKTGTTQNDCDKWMIGYTPYYLCGVWYGYEYPRELTGLLRNPCVDIWDDLMIDIHKEIIGVGKELKSFPEDDNVISAEFCSDSGKLLSSSCEKDPRGERGETGYFKKGTEPHVCCDCHILVPYDKVNSGVAHFGCRFENVSYVGMIRANRSFPIQVYVEDAQYVWRYAKNKEFTLDGHSAFFKGILKDGEYSGISPVSEQFNRACPYCNANRITE